MYTRILLSAVTVFTLFTTSCVTKEYYVAEPGTTTPPPPQYNYIFDDNFDNNVNNWAFADHNNAAFVTIAGSRLKYSYLPPNDGSNTVAINTGARLHRNFLIQSRIRSDYSMGIVFGVNNNNYGYSFFIDNDGYYALYKEGDANTGLNTIINRQFSAAINPEGWNDVEFEQFGNYWTGYVNGTKLFEIPAQYIEGSKIGYIVLAGTTGYADYMTVQW
jgi:hypothetical protein